MPVMVRVLPVPALASITCRPSSDTARRSSGRETSGAVTRTPRTDVRPAAASPAPRAARTRRRSGRPRATRRGDGPPRSRRRRSRSHPTRLRGVELGSRRLTPHQRRLREERQEALHRPPGRPRRASSRWRAGVRDRLEDDRASFRATRCAILRTRGRTTCRTRCRIHSDSWSRRLRLARADGRSRRRERHRAARPRAAAGRAGRRTRSTRAPRRRSA